MRINKFIATHLGIGRRQVDQMINDGLVLINQQPAKLGDKIDENSKICYKKDNNWIPIEAQKTETILFYKPIFSLVSKKGEKGKKTIYDLLPKTYNSFKPAGRLDYMSEGLLVLSQDGDLIYELTHPRNNTEKIYLVGLTQEMKTDHLKRLQNGVTIDDYKLRPVKITKVNNPKVYSYLNLSPKATWYTFELHEGRNNQIRKMCKMFDYKLVRLIRIQHGQFLLTPQLHNKKFLPLKTD